MEAIALYEKTRKLEIHFFLRPITVARRGIDCSVVLRVLGSSDSRKI